MPSTFRIPKARSPASTAGILKAYARRTWGAGPRQRLRLLPPAGRCSRRCWASRARSSKWDALDPTLKSYAQLASAGVIGCSWCLDFGYFMAHNDGLDLAKVREVPRWRESDVFTPLERDVLEYAEAMSATPPTVTDEMVADLLAGGLGAKAVVELHPDGRAGEHALAVQLRGRASQSPGLLRRVRAAPRRTVERVSTGEAAGNARGCREPRPERRRFPTRPIRGRTAALHGRLRDARLGGRRRGRRCRRRGCGGPTVDHREVRDPRAYLVRIVTRLSLNRIRTVSRRRETYVGPWLPEPLLTVPDVADDVELADSVSTAMLPGAARRSTPDRAGGVRAARGLRRALRRDRRGGRQARRPRCARSRTGPASTSPPGVPASVSTAPSSDGRARAVPGRCSTPATCRR